MNHLLQYIRTYSLVNFRIVEVFLHVPHELNLNFHHISSQNRLPSSITINIFTLSALIMADFPLVPSWLVGTWKRSYIKRANSETGILGEPDSTVEVTYIQTPWAFVDIRRPPITIERNKEVAMAFAGMTTVNPRDDKSNTPPLVNWHTCLEMDSPDMDCLERWTHADNGTPKETEDKGYFKDVSKEVGISHAFRENDPDNTLEELWIRKDDGDNQFLAARKDNKVLLVISGKYFGFADQEKNIFVSGIVSEHKELHVEMSASEKSLEGTTLSIDMKGWKILPGSTIDIETIL